jgi:hypothetical protein
MQGLPKRARLKPKLDWLQATAPSSSALPDIERIFTPHVFLCVLDESMHALAALVFFNRAGWVGEKTADESGESEFSNTP